MTSDTDPTPPLDGGTPRPEDFEYIITLDDDFQTIDASPRRRHDHGHHGPRSPSSISTFSDIDARSDGGETIETASADAESDAATVTSVASSLADSHFSISSDALQFPDPHSPLLGRSQTLSSDHDLVGSAMSSDRGWSAVQDSEVTVRDTDRPHDLQGQHIDDRIENHPGEPISEGLFDSLRGHEMQSTRLEKMSWEPLHGEGTREAGVPQATKPGSSTTSAYDADRLHVDARLPQSVRPKDVLKPTPNQSFLQSFSPEWKTYAGSFLGLLLWATCLFGFLATFIRSDQCGLVSVQELTGRQRALTKALASHGISYSNGSSILAQDILWYPAASSSRHAKEQIPAPTDFLITRDAEQMFVSLPRDISACRYPRRPSVKVFDGVCDEEKQSDCVVQIKKQIDLVPGLTYLLLEIPEQVPHFKLALSTATHSKLVSVRPHTGVRSTLTELLLKANVVGAKIVQVAVNDTKEIAVVLEQSRRRWLHKSFAQANKTMTRLLPEIYAARRGLEQKVRAGISTAQVLGRKAKRAAYLSSINKAAHEANLGWRKFQQSSRERASKFVNTAGSDLQVLSKKASAVLSRAQKNGVRIAHRAGHYGGKALSWMQKQL